MTSSAPVNILCLLMGAPTVLSQKRPFFSRLSETDSTEQQICESISADISDAWCTRNCNRARPNCPDTMCICDSSTTDTPTNAPTSAPHIQQIIQGTQAINTINDGYRIPSISGCGTGQRVSLTFDDGPFVDSDETQTLLDALDARGICATFFVSPNSWGQAGDTRVCDMIATVSQGCHEIQSHSFNHPNFQSLSDAQIIDELNTVRDFVVECGGVAPTIFRPPYGSLSKAQAEFICQDLGYILSFWNLDSNDWRAPNDADSIIDDYIGDLNRFGGDSINILMHDHSVYQIVDQIIDLFDDGYEFITQSECFAYCDTIDEDGICSDMHGNDNWALAGLMR